MKNNNIEYAEKYEKEVETPDVDAILELNTISMRECTGLIPAGIKDDVDVENYEEIFPYLTSPEKPKK